MLWSPSAAAPARRPARAHDRRARQARATMPDPSCPELALPGDRQRHRLPGQHRPDQPALPRAAGRQDQVLDPDPGAADQQPALLLQRLLRHAARGAPRDPAPHPGHQPAALQPPHARARSTSSAPTSARRSSSAPRCRSRRATSSASPSRPGPRPSPRASRPTTSGAPAAKPGKCTNSTDVRQGEPQQTASADAPPTAAATPRPACSTPPPVEDCDEPCSCERAWALGRPERAALGPGASPAPPTPPRQDPGSPGLWAAPPRWRSGSGTR